YADIIEPDREYAVFVKYVDGGGNANYPLREYCPECWSNQVRIEDGHFRIRGLVPGTIRVYVTVGASANSTPSDSAPTQTGQMVGTVTLMMGSEYFCRVTRSTLRLVE